MEVETSWLNVWLNSTSLVYSLWITTHIQRSHRIKSRSPTLLMSSMELETECPTAQWPQQHTRGPQKNSIASPQVTWYAQPASRSPFSHASLNFILFFGWLNRIKHSVQPFLNRQARWFPISRLSIPSSRNGTRRQARKHRPCDNSNTHSYLLNSAS